MFNNFNCLVQFLLQQFFAWQFGKVLGYMYACGIHFEQFNQLFTFVGAKY